MGYELFLMDVGLYRNTLGYEYKCFAVLATDNTWFKNVWELLHDFNAHASFDEKYQLHPIRDGDHSLMELFSRHYGGPNLASLNVFRQHKNIVHVSCIVLCDGQTIDPSFLSITRGNSNLHKVPLQYPTPQDHALWKSALKLISSTYYMFPTKLDNYINAPHRCFTWRTNENGTVLHESLSAEEIMVYVPSIARMSRSGTTLTKSHTIIGASTLPFYASTSCTSATTICLHSWTAAYIPTTIPSTFWEQIWMHNNPSLWQNLQCDGDGTWIWEGLCMGSLVIIHDGSYMKKVSQYVCSAAVMIYCTQRGSVCKCTITEKSEAARSYRGKILGAIITQFILRAAVQGKMGPYPIILEDCDNLGIVQHGHTPRRLLSTTQTHTDLLRVLKHYIVKQPFLLKFLHVASHADDTKTWESCSLKEK
jgi:hypothetical protein